MNICDFFSFFPALTNFWKRKEKDDYNNIDGSDDDTSDWLAWALS